MVSSMVDASSFFAYYNPVLFMGESMKISIRLVLLFSFLAVIWGTFFLTTTSSQITSEQVLEEHFHAIMENIASYAMEQSQNYLSKAQRATELTKSLLRSQVLVQENGQALENYFLEQLVSSPDISGIYLGTPEGDFFFVSRNDKYSPGGIRTKIISHENGERQVRYVWRDAQRNLVAEEVDTTDIYDPRVRPWYQGAMAANGIFWSDPYIFYTSQNPGITISGPVYNQEGKLSGIVGVDIEIDQLSTFISNLRISDNGYAFMLNQNRDVVAFHDVEQIKFYEAGGKANSRLVKIDEFQDKLSRAAFSALGIAQDKTSQILLDRAEYVSFEVGGENYQAMFTPFPDPQWPWIIGMYLPEDDYLGALKQNRINNYLITFAISVLASILILFIARSIARPIIGLQRYAEDISAGDFDLEKDHILSRCWFKEVSETVGRFDGLMVELDQAHEDQVKAEENLRRKETEYTSLVESLKVGVFRISWEGEILNANLAFARMLGCSTVAELKKHNITRFYFNHDDRQQLIDTLRVSRQVNNWDLQFKPIDQQEPIWVSIYGLLKEDSTDCYIEGLIEDITERKHSEEMLILAERMAAVGTMASGVAHEFNNIHTGVLGYAELGSRLEGIPESARAYFKTIHNASLRARDLTENLLSCSTQRSSQRLPADLNMTIRESYALVKREFINDGVDIECDFGDIPYLLMDHAQVGQVVLNFLINAHHSMIGCPEKKVRISSGVSEGHAWVKVTDSGCGIPEDKYKKIFTPFFSTKGAHARSGSPQATVRGTGLGLAVCHTIAKNHNGRIDVVSKVGFGSSFTFSLPMNDVSEEVLALQVEDPKSFVNPEQGSRILVVDDEQNVRELIMQVLTSQGYEVIVTDDGSEGLQIIRDERVDLVLVDMQMPKMSGLDFLGQLQTIEEGRRPVAVVVTGKISDDTASEQADLDVYGSLAKPFAIDELQSLVHSAITQKLSTIDV